MATKFEVLLSAKLSKDSVSQIQQQLKNISNGTPISIKADTKSTNNLKQSLKELGNQADKTSGQAGGLSDVVSKFAQWQIVGDIIHGAKNAMSDMVDQIFDLDNVLTELSKVTDLSSEQLQKLSDDAFDVATNIGSTGQAVLEATQIFAQAGYEAKDALDLSEQAIILKNVSEAGATAEESAEALIATMKGFKMEAQDTSHVVDSLNEVSNKYSVSVNDLTKGMKRSSAALASSNNTFEEMIGLLTAGTEVLRNSSKVANGLSTISARLTAENDEYIKSITGGLGTLNEQGTELRSTYDILHDLADAWENLSSIEKQELTEVVAGKTQRSLFAAEMTNFSSAIGATETALNSEGSAVAENAKRMESLNGKVEQLNNAWQKLSKDTINSNFVKTLLDVATNTVKIVDATGGLIPTLTTILGVVMVLKSQKIAQDVQTGYNAIVSMINGLKILKQQLLGAKDANVIYLGSVDSVQASTTAATASTQLFAASIGSIIAIISLGVMAFNAINSAIEENRRNLLKNIETESNSIKSKKEKIDSLKEEISELEKENEKLVENYKNLGKQDEQQETIIKNKEEEIEKRKQNVEQMQQEIEKQKLLLRGQISSLKFSGTLGKSFGLTQVFAGMRSNITREEGVRDVYQRDVQNTAEYKKKIEDLIVVIEKKKEATKQGSFEDKQYQGVINDLNKKLNENQTAYENDRAAAEKIYDAAKFGVEITEKEKKAVQDYLDVEEERFEKIDEDTYVLKNNTDAIEENANKYQESMDKISQAQSNYEQIIQNNIDLLTTYAEKTDILTEANDMLTSSGTLTAEMFQKLKDNDLLQYLIDTDGKLRLNKDAFEEAAQAAKDNAIAAAQDSAAQQILQLVLADQNGTLDETAKKLGLVNTNSDSTNTQHAVSEILKIGEAAKISQGQLVAMFKTMETGKDADVSEEGLGDRSAQLNQYIQQVINNTNQYVKGISAISLASSKSAKSAKSSAKSTREEYKATIDTLYNYNNALDNAKENVDKLKDSLSDTDNYEDQVKYINQLIDALNRQINATKDLKNAQSSQINDYINQLRQQGFAISYNADRNELYIENMQHLADFSGDTAKSLEKLIEKIQSMNNDNRKLDNSVRDLTKDTKKYYDQLANIPEQKLKKFNELMSAFQKSQLEQIENEIEDLQHAMEKDPRIQALESQIEALEKQNDELDRQESLEEKLLAIEEAKKRLIEAQQQRNLLVYTEDGWQYVSDPEAISQAQQELSDAQKSLNEQVRDDQIDRLKSEKEQIENSYQDRIDALQDFLKEQNYLIDSSNREAIETFDELRKALAEFGLDNAQYLGKATDWLNKYNKALSNLNNNVNSKLATSTGLTDGLLYSSAVQSRINNALSNEITSKGMTLSNVSYTPNGSNAGQTIYIDNIELPNVQNAQDFVEALKDLPRLASTLSTTRK